MVELLKKHFVAFALDNASVPNATPAQALWLKDRGGRACTQGMAVFTAGGQMLGLGGGYHAAPGSPLAIGWRAEVVARLARHGKK